MTITCDGGASLDGWHVDWTFPGNQQLSNAWNASCSQSGATVSCGDAGWNGTVPSGGSTSFGFNATFSGSNGTPSELSLN